MRGESLCTLIITVFPLCRGPGRTSQARGHQLSVHSAEMDQIVLTADQAHGSLQKTVDGLRKEAAALAAARDAAAGDHFKLLELAGPIMAKVQHPIVSELGFTADDDGLMHYTSAVQKHESDNVDVGALLAQIHLIVLFGEAAGGQVPKLALEPKTKVSYEEVLLSARGAKPPPS